MRPNSDTDEAALVVGYDLTAASRAALEAAINLATRLGAALHVVHVVTLGDFPPDTDRADWEARADRRVRAERDSAQERLRSWGGQWEWHTEHGHPASALGRVAADVDALMIIVGKPSGLGASLQRLLSRSVSRGLMKSGAHPVLLVPTAPNDGGQALR